jgi:hypothetical protein
MKKTILAVCVALAVVAVVAGAVEVAQAGFLWETND